MNTSIFINLLKHPNAINTKDISDVRSIIDEFPYFQTARALYLKGLNNKSSFKYNQELKITAAYTTDRSVLFDFITSEDFQQNKISETIKQGSEHLKNLELNDFEDISSNQETLVNTTPEPKETLVFSIEEGIEEQKTPEEKLEIGKPLQFNKNEMHSFSEWLKITSFKPIIRDEEQDQESIKQKDQRAEKFDLIDKFIATNPKIVPLKKDLENQNIALESTHEPETLMTETLARIYVEQKNYSKAIKAYKILSLKYPEKSGFFADQIQAVKDLKKQNK
ncbi:MAG: hypothetical protein HKO92_02870 [Flavobacteriaceae bacterium]|nr:hypothetical protein [Flavobacteriaceae bacterium]